MKNFHHTPTHSLPPHTMSPKLDFALAIRIVVNFATAPDYVDSSLVKLAVFGKSGKKSFRHKDKTWYIFHDPLQDMSTVACGDLEPDPEHLRVYYFLFRTEDLATTTRACTGTDRVIDHIGRVTLDFAKSCPSPTRMYCGKKGKKSPNISVKDTISAMTREEYFHHQYLNMMAKGLLDLLKAPLPGFDKDGMVEDGTGDEDIRFVGHDQACNLDPESVELFVALPNLKVSN